MAHAPVSCGVQDDDKGVHPREAGEYTFACGMNVMRGKLIVEPP